MLPKSIGEASTVPADTVLGLIGFAVVATGTPGGATAVATASGSHFGLVRSIPVIAGITVALATMAAAAAAGLGGLILAVPALAVALKVIGTAYLVWLAWRIAGSASPQDADQRATPIGFRGGVLLLLYNPKGWAMTLAAAASFAAVSVRPALLAALFGLVFAVAALVSLTAWCLLGVVLSRLLTTRRRWTIFNIAMASLLVASIVPIWTED